VIYVFGLVVLYIHISMHAFAWFCSIKGTSRRLILLEVLCLYMLDREVNTLQLYESAVQMIKSAVIGIYRRFIADQVLRRSEGTL
jgi:hypothetical protein